MTNNRSTEVAPSFVEKSDLIKASEVRHHYNIGENEANRLCREGEWPALKIAGTWFVSVSGLGKWERQKLAGIHGYSYE